MSQKIDNIDEIIVFEYDKDCDSVECEELQIFDEQEEEFMTTIEEDNDGEETKIYIEALDDADIPQELINQPFEEIAPLEEQEEDKNKNTNETPNEASGYGIKRYLLFDDLVATVVDYDEDNTPIVKFTGIQTDKDEKLPVECGICPDIMRKSKLAKHLQTHLMPGTNRYKCIYCDETYKDYKYLASHARRHMGIRPYVCEICKLYFSTKQDMRVHNQRRHYEKEHICEICGKTFAQNTMLKRHRESTHEQKRRFKCDHCPKAYYKNFSLQEHIRSVHMGQRRMLKCPFCGMQCLDAHKMARHRKLWHLNQSQFECEICQEKFTNVHYFDAHKRSIQCRNNTRRKMEEEQEQRVVAESNQKKKENESKEFQIIEASDNEVEWTINDQDGELVELVDADQIFQADDVIFEIVDENETN